MKALRPWTALGGHPALEFLNSLWRSHGMAVETIGEGRAYLELLGANQLLEPREVQNAIRNWTVCQLDGVAARARAQREWLRPMVAAWVADPDGEIALTTEVLTRLNGTLAADSQFFQLWAGERRVPLPHLTRAWTDPAQLLVPPVAAVADLLAHGDRALVKNCDASDCDLLFYDHTKSRRRRWCSMQTYGNRAKARAHRERMT